MKRHMVIFILLSISIQLVCAQARTENSEKKKLSFPVALGHEYVGLEPMESVDPEHPEYKWFHENTLLIRNNEAILDKVPVVFEKGNKVYSASDGGFRTFRGRFFQKGGQLFVSLRLFESDYVAIQINCEPYAKVKTVPVNVSANSIQDRRDSLQTKAAGFNQAGSSPENARRRTVRTYRDAQVLVEKRTAALQITRKGCQPAALIFETLKL